MASKRKDLTLHLKYEVINNNCIIIIRKIKCLHNKIKKPEMWTSIIRTLQCPVSALCALVGKPSGVTGNSVTRKFYSVTATIFPRKFCHSSNFNAVTAFPRKYCPS